MQHANFGVYYWEWGVVFEFFYFVVLSFSFTLQSALADKLTVLSGEWVPFSLKKRFEQRVLKRRLITAGGGEAWRERESRIRKH